MSRRDRRGRLSVDDLLRGTLPSRATADELVDLIERLNPTGRGLSPRLEAERYRLKAQLQSQLLRRHFHSVAIVIEDHGILALALRVSGRSAAHVPLEELDDDVRAVVQRAIDTGALEDANAPLAAGGRGRAAGSVGATDSAGESEPPGDTRARLEDLLEVWDHAPILALASTTPHVRLAQAVVHAREGNIEEACKLVADASGARASEVWSYVGENALANANIDRMVEARDALARLDLGGAVLGRLEAELEVRRRDDLARRDDELRAALVTTASDAEREELATAHLRRNAASHLARRLLDEVRVRRVLARREQLLERAAVSDAMEAARLLRMARAEGAENLDARIQRLEAEAETERVASEARTLETACAGSDRAGALATWLGASPEARSRVALPADLERAAELAPSALPRRRVGDVARACIACVLARDLIERGEIASARQTIAGAGKIGLELASKRGLVKRLDELERLTRTDVIEQNEVLAAEVSNDAVPAEPSVPLVLPKGRITRRRALALLGSIEPRDAAARRFELLAEHQAAVVELGSKLPHGHDRLILLVERDDVMGGLYFDRATELAGRSGVRICVTSRTDFVMRFEHLLALDVLADLRERIYACPVVVVAAQGALVENAASPAYPADLVREPSRREDRRMSSNAPSDWQDNFPAELLALVRAHLAVLPPISDDVGEMSHAVRISVGEPYFLAVQADPEELRVRVVPMGGEEMLEDPVDCELRMSGTELAVILPVRVPTTQQLIALPVLEICGMRRPGVEPSQVPSLRFGPEPVDHPASVLPRPASRSLVIEASPRIEQLFGLGKKGVNN